MRISFKGERREGRDRRVVGVSDRKGKEREGKGREGEGREEGMMGGGLGALTMLSIDLRQNTSTVPSSIAAGLNVLWFLPTFQGRVPSA